MMIIGIDASRAKSEFMTGTENYSRNLILNLLKIDRKNKYILYARSELGKEFEPLAKNCEVKILKTKKFWTQIRLSYEMYKNPPDILFVPAHVLPPITPKKTLLTIHDFAWKKFPETYTKQQFRLQELSIKRAIKKKSAIIVYSNSTKNDLINFYHVDHNKIFFVPMGFEAAKFNRLTDEKVPLQIKAPYILFVGRLEKRKNLVRIIEAYGLLRKERKIKEKLLLVGKPGYGYDEIKNTIAKTKEIKNDIIETGYVDDVTLRNLYYNASLFLYPSLYEGFGFPILEAFAAQTPVITSNVASMKEIAKSATLLVNPKNTFEITAAMSQILNKPSLKKSLISKGKVIANSYSWQNCANETLSVIEGLK